MKSRVGRLFPLALMLAMGALSFWLNVLTTWQTPVRTPQDQAQPEYSIEGIHARRFDNDGRPWQQLDAKLMWKLPQHPQIYVDSPQLQQYQAGKPDYRINAERGVYDKPHNVADFSGNVRLSRPAQADAPAMLLRTPALRLDNRNGIASNRAPLTLDYGSSRLNAVGFLYNHQAGQLQLLSKVRIHYAP